MSRKQRPEFLPVAVFYFIQLFLVDLFQVAPVLFIQLGEHVGQLLTEAFGAFGGPDGEAHDLLFPGALLEGLAFAGAEPHFIAAEFPADVGDRAVAGLCRSAANLRYKTLRYIDSLAKARLSKTRFFDN